MHSYTAGRLLVLSSAVVLAACQDAVTAPKVASRRTLVSPTIGACNGRQSERQVQSLGDINTLGVVIITANYPGFGGMFNGMPWEIMQRMRFPLNVGADQAPCLNAPDVTYTVDTLFVAPLDPLPVPEGVDPDFWNSLSPREQRAILAKAEVLMKLQPNRFPTVGAAIDSFFGKKITESKTRSKIRANDFGLGAQDGEMLAGGIYGCTLYRRFTQDPEWFLSAEDTFNFVLELITAFSEAEYAYAPLRAALFGRNGAIGSAMAAADAALTDCGWLVFNSVPSGRIKVTDPYSTPSGSAAPSPGSQQPSLPPSSGLPDGWWDQ